MAQDPDPKSGRADIVEEMIGKAFEVASTKPASVEVEETRVFPSFRQPDLELGEEVIAERLGDPIVVGDGLIQILPDPTMESKLHACGGRKPARRMRSGPRDPHPLPGCVRRPLHPRHHKPGFQGRGSGARRALPVLPRLAWKPQPRCLQASWLQISWKGIARHPEMPAREDRDRDEGWCHNPRLAPWAIDHRPFGLAMRLPIRRSAVLRTNPAAASPPGRGSGHRRRAGGPGGCRRVSMPRPGGPRRWTARARGGRVRRWCG